MTLKALRNRTAPGVNVVGYFAAESGTGEIARAVVASLRAAAIQHTVIVNGLSTSRQRSGFQAPRIEELFDVNIICANADELPRIAKRLGSLLSGRYTIGVWAWEVEILPSTLAVSEAHLDEVWAISRFSADAIRHGVHKPVHIFSLPVTLPSTPIADRAALGLPPGFVFLNCFDYLSVFERKNPIALVNAYRAAFPRESDGAHLTIKSINGDRDPGHRAALRHAANGRHDIHFIDRYMTAADQSALIARCDAYVSLHRSEGYGLPLAEAMLRNKPVIATNYSGNLDFMSPTNSWLIPYELVDVPPGCDPYPSGARWANPYIGAAAEAMREVFDDPSRAAARARLGREEIATSHTPGSQVGFIRERLRAAMPLQIAGDKPHDRPGARLINSVSSRWLAQTRVRILESRLRDDVAGAHPRLARPYALVRTSVDGMVNRYLGLDRLHAKVAQFDAELSAEPYKSNPEALMVIGRNGTRTLGYSDLTATGHQRQTYVDFEDIFRGPEPMIRQRFRSYAQLLIGCSRVVDIGCGRGEFLDVAAELGVAAVGVDIDGRMLERAKGRGHTVIQSDAIEYLQSAPQDGLDVIFSAQLIEHLEPLQLRHLLAAAFRALRAGGILVAETVNPHSPMAAKTFWLDYSHQRPIFPEALLFLCRDAGFRKAEVLFPYGTGDLGRDRRFQGDYAVLATKA